MDKPRLSLEVSFIPDQEEKIIAESIFEQKYKNGRLSKSEKGQATQEKTSQFAVKKRKELDPDGPEDKHSIVQCIMFVMGIIHLLPFTFFITANEYWMYKFRNVTSNSTDANDRTYLQANFASLNHLISVGPSTVFSFFVIFLGHKIETKTRIIVALVVSSLVFVVETTFVKINTDDWQVGFFALTVMLMLVLSCSMTFSSTANMIVVSKFPDEYMKMYMIGEGIAGLFSALLRLISIAVAPSTEGAALIYFVTGTTIMTVSSFLFYLSTHTDFFKYYTKDMKEDTKRRIPRPSEFLDVLRYTWPLLILSVVGTLIPQSSITNLIVSEYYGTDSVWGTKYFITVITYLLNSVCGIAGRLLFYVCEIAVIITIILAVRSVIVTAAARWRRASSTRHSTTFCTQMLFSAFRWSDRGLQQSRPDDGDKSPKPVVEWLFPSLGLMNLMQRISIYDLSFPLLYVVSLGREIIFTPLLALCNAKPRHHLPVIFGHDWQYAIIAGTQSFTGGYFMNISYLKNLRIVPPEKLELSWMVNMFVMKIASIATSPLGVVAVSLL